MCDTMEPRGCLECGNVIYEMLVEGKCPFCNSIEVHSMQEILGQAQEHRRFMYDLGLVNEEEL